MYFQLKLDNRQRHWVPKNTLQALFCKVPTLLMHRLWNSKSVLFILKSLLYKVRYIELLPCSAQSVFSLYLSLGIFQPFYSHPLPTSHSPKWNAKVVTVTGYILGLWSWKENGGKQELFSLRPITGDTKMMWRTARADMISKLSSQMFTELVHFHWTFWTIHV